MSLGTDEKKDKRMKFGMRIWHIGLLALAGALRQGCAIEVENLKPSRLFASERQPPGSVYTGWRVFQQRCASCHGQNANGGSGPDLLPIMRQLGPRRFAGLVLERYDWTRPAGQPREEWLEQAVQRRETTVSMPAWQDQPPVHAHVMDLYAYLSARADGRQGLGQPAR